MSKRLNLRLPPEIADVMDRLADERGLTHTAVVRQALGVLQAMHDGAKQGHYTGLTKNREDLEILLVAPL